MSAKPNLTLTYFDIPGRAEAIRLIFEIGGVDYKVIAPFGGGQRGAVVACQLTSPPRRTAASSASSGRT
jgi:hypothetical protein